MIKNCTTVHSMSSCLRRDIDISMLTLSPTNEKSREVGAVSFHGSTAKIVTMTEWTAIPEQLRI